MKRTVHLLGEGELEVGQGAGCVLIQSLGWSDKVPDFAVVLSSGEARKLARILQRHAGYADQLAAGES